MTLKTWNTIHGYFHDYDEWTFLNICKNLILYIAKLMGVSFDDMYCSLGVFLKWIVALHCESLKCWQTYLDRYHQIRIDFDEWTVQKGGMNSGHIKFFSTIKEIKINSMIKDISPIFSQQDPFGVVENTFASIRVLSSIWRQKWRELNSKIWILIIYFFHSFFKN